MGCNMGKMWEHHIGKSWKHYEKIRKHEEGKWTHDGKKIGEHDDSPCNFLGNHQISGSSVEIALLCPEDDRIKVHVDDCCLELKQVGWSKMQGLTNGPFK